MIFPSAAIIDVAPGASGTFRHNAIVCPICDSLAYIADATFSTTAGEVLAAIKAPNVTHPMLLAFRAAAQRAYLEQKPPAVLAAEFEQISPALAAVVRKSADKGFYRAALLLIILAVIRSTTFDLNRGIDQVIQYMTSPQAICNTPDPPPPPEPPAPEKPKMPDAEPEPENPTTI